MGTLVLGAGVRLSCRTVGTRTFYSCGLAALLLLIGSRGLQNAIAEGDTRTISLHHTHTNEDITITFKREGRYDEAALDKLNWFLRDWRREQQIRMDPHLIDLVWEVQRETGSKEPIWVVCGYRSPETNAMLRRRSDGVAKYSQHMLGHAMDFYIPGVPLEQLRVIGLRLQRGGVGFYPTSGSPFVHMDTGGVRHWPRMTREQLVRVFPDGRTVHIPTDGRPLAGYALALADLRKRGDNPSQMSIEAARSAGVQIADGSVARRIISPFKKLFGLGRDDEDDDAGGSAPAVMASSEPAPSPEPLRVRAKAAVVAAIDRAEDKVSAQKVKLIQVASRAEEKLAADKTKIARAASKVHVISRAEAAPAVVTPSQIIIARGFWQGLPDGMTAARPAALNPLAGLPRGTEPEMTGSIGSFAAESAPRPAALAYAEPAAQEAPLNGATAPAAVNVATPHVTVTNAIAVQTGNNAMTVAVKRVNGRPASAILTVANKMSALLGDSERLNDPWLRAIVQSPSVTRFLSVTMLGAHDFRFLAALLVRPANSVMMTFAADPQPGLAQDHFSGSAIVFLSTITYPMQTADLR
ncbi:MAG: DUF882 domain-containing protein [Xanthobacteraceae bacterium]